MQLLRIDAEGMFRSMSAVVSASCLEVAREWDAGDAEGEEKWSVPAGRIPELLAELPAPTILEALRWAQGDPDRCEQLRRALSAMQPNVKTWDWYR